MPKDFQAKLQSSQFMFLVGERQEKFSVHSAVLADLSPAMDELINGSMKESVERCASLADVSPETFTLFGQFAYAGDYEPRSPIIEATLGPEEDSTTECDASTARNSAKGSPEPSDHEFADQGWNCYAPVKNSRTRAETSDWSVSPSKYDKLHESFLLCVQYRTEMKYQYEAKSNKESRENFSPTLLGHAELYVLADRWAVDDLKTLVLQKLHTTLSSFTLFSSRFGDITEAIKFVYDRTCTGDDLRRLLVSYVSSNLRVLGTSEEYLQLIREGGDFSVDMWTVVGSNFLE